MEHRALTHSVHSVRTLNTKYFEQSSQILFAVIEESVHLEDLSQSNAGRSSPIPCVPSSCWEIPTPVAPLASEAIVSDKRSSLPPPSQSSNLHQL
jgi:hypothetical protein